MNKCLFRRGSQIRKFLSYRHIPGLVIEQGKHKKHIRNILSSKFWESKAIFKIPIPNNQIDLIKNFLLGWIKTTSLATSCGQIL